MSEITFEWDDDKAELNCGKHGVTFDEAKSVFYDVLSLTGYDPLHSIVEDRFVTMGMSNCGKFLVVSHTDRNGAIRIINARIADRSEKKRYENGDFP